MRPSHPLSAACRPTAALWFALLAATFLATPGAAQPAPPIQDLVRAQQERSWISPGRVFKWWWHEGNLAPSNVDSLLFEANIAPTFTIWGPENVRLLSAVKAVVITPRVALRMRTALSEPVRSPSYNPFLTLFTSMPFRDDPTDMLLLRLAHHSNGQEGEAVLPGGELNLVDGSFSTNYVELGGSISRIRSGNYFFVRPSVEWHFGQDDMAQDFYGQWRINLSLHRLTNKSDALLGLYQDAHFVLQADLGYHPDRGWLPFEQRIDFSLSGALLSPFGGTMGPFAEFFVGRDYYNLRYRTEHVKILRFGFTTSGGEYRIF